MNKYLSAFSAFLALGALAMVGVNVYVLMNPEATGMRWEAVHFAAIGVMFGCFILMGFATVVLWTED